MTRKVLSEEAERSVERLMGTLAFGRRTRLLWAVRGRLIGTPGVVASQPSHYLVLPHLTAIAEEFSRFMLVASSAPLLVPDHPLRADMWRRAEDQAEGAWESHKKAWMEWHSIDIRDGNGYGDLMSFVQARNAIMHGLGALTRKQTRKDGGRALLAQLRALGIESAGLRLVISQTALDQCASSAREYIEWLDSAVAGAGLLSR